ncbi:MAG: hypothetical protein WEB58_18080 [Planctomycetaceae bacterium]
MSDHSQTVVDQDATESESPRLGAFIHQWLIDEGIVSADATDCVLSSDAGYAPGPNYEKATSVPKANLLSLITNGLDIITKRNIFDSGEGGFELVCSACSHRFEGSDAWGDAVDEWYENRGSALLPCPRCGKSKLINEWEHDPAWGFANLGFQFWNWPQLSDEFIKGIGERLGHRVILVRCMV